MLAYKRNGIEAYQKDNASHGSGVPRPVQHPCGPFPSCVGCHYAAHGRTCYTAEGDCLRTDMLRIGQRKAVRDVI